MRRTAADVASAESGAGALLKQLRQDARLTQEALAERAGLSARGLSDIECGRRRPRPSTLALVAEALALSPSQRLALLAASGLPTERPEPAAAGSPLSSGADRPRHNLPVQPSPLMGREREVEAVRSHLLRQDVRLVTVTGPGGIGKTRLGCRSPLTPSTTSPMGCGLCGSPG
jgi:transcriptional regulator with XRE-family HTH domain